MFKNIVTFKKCITDGHCQERHHSIDRIRVLFVFHCNYVSIWYRFWNTQHQIMPWSWNPGLGSFKIIENGAVQQIMYDLLLVCHCKYSSILYHYRVIWHWKYCDFEIWFIGHSRSLKTVSNRKIELSFLFAFRSNCAMSSHFDTMHERHRQISSYPATTQQQRLHLCIVSRGNKWVFWSKLLQL